MEKFNRKFIEVLRKHGLVDIPILLTAPTRIHVDNMGTALTGNVTFEGPAKRTQDGIVWIMYRSYKRYVRYEGGGADEGEPYMFFYIPEKKGPLNIDIGEILGRHRAGEIRRDRIPKGRRELKVEDLKSEEWAALDTGTRNRQLAAYREMMGVAKKGQEEDDRADLAKIERELEEGRRYYPGTVLPPGRTQNLRLIPAILPYGMVGRPYPPFQLRAEGGTPPYRWGVRASNASTFAPGVDVDPNTGVLSGTPATSGEYHQIVFVADSGGQVDSKTFALIINPAIGAGPHEPAHEPTVLNIYALPIDENGKPIRSVQQLRARILATEPRRLELIGQLLPLRNMELDSPPDYITIIAEYAHPQTGSLVAQRGFRLHPGRNDLILQFRIPFGGGGPGGGGQPDGKRPKEPEEGGGSKEGEGWWFEGEVRDTNNRPVSGVKVSLFTGEYTYTDQNGKYRLPPSGSLLPGEYTITCEPHDHPPQNAVIDIPEKGRPKLIKPPPPPPRATHMRNKFEGVVPFKETK